MSGFSPEWLALREPADVAARSRAVFDACARHFGERSISVCDLGAGTGSTLRAVADALPAEQAWTLVDNDAGNLAVAFDVLSAWADKSARDGDTLKLNRRGKFIAVSARVHDFALEPACWPQGVALVTASALFDLTSVAWIARFVRALAAQKLPLLAALSYDGIIAGTPAHPLDAHIAAAFNRHQTGDKGFGPAAGPAAAKVLEQELATAGYALTTGESPWVLESGELQRVTTQGIAEAAAETGEVTRAEAGTWRMHARTRLVIGHRDVFAAPRA